jgi:hypothetical protein
VTLQHPADHFVRDDQRPLRWFSAHLVQGSGRASIGVGVAFAVGEAPLVLVSGPALSVAGELGVDLLVDQAAELAVVEFGQLVDNLDLQVEGVADDAGRRECSAERADEDAVDPSGSAGSKRGGALA